MISIQSLILGEHTISRSLPHVGDDRVPGLVISGNDFYFYRLATVRYAMIYLLQSCLVMESGDCIYPELKEFIHIHFKCIRYRLFDSFKRDLSVDFRKNSELEIRMTKDISKLFNILKDI